MKKFLALILLTTATKIFATNYVVSSAADAMLQLKKAKAGDSILLKDGIYRDATIRFANTGGNDQQPVTFSAQHPGKVFFEGNSTLSVAGSYISVSGFTWQNGGAGVGTKSVIELKTDHADFSDCAVTNYNSDKNIDNKWVSVYGQYNTVTRCVFKDKNNLGATLTVWLTPGKEAHHTISYNYFLGRQNGPEADNGLESIRIGDSKTSFENAHCVVALNRFEECNGEIEIISNKSCHNSYLHNSFINSDGGLTLRHGNDCLVDGNFFDGGNKPKSYGVRFIGEGHVAVNNYFYNLRGSPNETFRAPVTLVTGVVNTPINGYFQVRRATVAGNVFVNCSLPDIRVGATPKREGATLAPDTLTISNNLFFDDNGTAGNVYEDVLAPLHLTIENNTVVGNLKANKNGFVETDSRGAKREGFGRITLNGKLLSSDEDTVNVPQGSKAGANWMGPWISHQINNRKYTLMSPGEVGPVWMR